MQLVKEGNSTEVQGEIDLSHAEGLIGLMLNYYQSSFVPFRDWLTKQERRFFIASVIIANKGLKYTSSEAKRLYKDKFNLRRQSDVRGYLVELENKNFLKSNVRTKKIQLPEFFVFDLGSQTVNFNITLNYNNGTNR